MYLPTVFISQLGSTKYFLIAFSLFFFAFMTPPLFAQEQGKPSTKNTSDMQMRSEQKPTFKLGEATTNLLSLQVSGTASSPTLLMLGVTSNLSWQRYLDSFKYKIPETFENKVPKTDN